MLTRRSCSGLVPARVVFVGGQGDVSRSLQHRTSSLELNFVSKGGTLEISPTCPIGEVGKFCCLANSIYFVLVHGQVTIIFLVSVCLFVCLFVHFFPAVFDPISIKLGHMLYVWV